GFIFVDNIAQPGPFFAARDFLAANPGWREHGCSTEGHKQAKAFDRARTTIKNTDFMVLRAPQAYIVGKQPCNFGRSRWWSSRITGLRLELAGKSGSGTLHVQLVFRGFGNVPVEMIGEGAIELNASSGLISVPTAVEIAGNFTYYTVEPWLIWQGSQPL